MSLFSQSVTPALRSHLDAQMAFFHDVSRSWTQSLQNIVEANIQLSQTLLEESTLAGRQLLAADRPTDAFSAAAARAQPAADKLRAYHQHISRVVADSQAELSRVAEQHVQETSRTASTLASEVARAASEETQNHIRSQQDALKNFRDPFQEARATSNAQQGNLQSAGTGNAQRAEQAGQQAQQSAKSATKPA